MSGIFQSKSSSKIIALIILILLTVWVLMGNSEAEIQLNPQEAVSKTPLVSVQVKQSAAEIVTKRLTLYGQTQASREILLRSQVSGKIVEVLIKEGASVKKGQVIAVVAIEDRLQRLAYLESLIRENELRYKATRSLRGSDLASETQSASTKTALMRAKSELKMLQLEIEHTKIKAPFDGILNLRRIEVGDFVEIGSIVGELIDTQPLAISADIAQKDINSVVVGQTAQLQVFDQYHVGKVAYIASKSDTKTHTFRVEFETENKQALLKAGISAKIELPLNQVSAHKISASSITLNDAGIIGIKVVAQNHRVEFLPVEIIKSDSNYVWVSRLPQSVSIITVGQGYVVSGELVKPVIEDEPLINDRVSLNNHAVHLSEHQVIN